MRYYSRLYGKRRGSGDLGNPKIISDTPRKMKMQAWIRLIREIENSDDHDEESQHHYDDYTSKKLDVISESASCPALEKSFTRLGKSTLLALRFVASFSSFVSFVVVGNMALFRKALIIA